MEGYTVRAIFWLVLCGLILVSLLLKDYLKSQIHVLELLVTLVVGQLPALFISSLVKFHTDNPYELVILITCVVFPLLLVLAGSLWGLDCARKLDEQRTWPRLGLMAAGWGLICGAIGMVVFFTVAIVLIIQLRLYARPGFIPKELVWIWFIFLGFTMLTIPAVLINRRCKRRTKNLKL